MAKEKKKTASESSSSSDEGEEKALFGEAHRPEAEGKIAKGRKDRGPFGGGDIVRFHGESSSESEPLFREAPAVPKASNQLKLMQYTKKTPGRLASRLLLKMQQEGAQGAVGANPVELGELTPPAAVHYFHTMMVAAGVPPGDSGAQGTPNAMHHPRSPSAETASESSRHSGAAGEGHREELHRRTLGRSPVPGTSGTRRGRSPGKRRRGAHEQGTPAGPEVEGLSPQGDRPEAKGSREKGGEKGKERGKGKGGDKDKEKKD